MLPREVELDQDRTGLSGRAKSVKRFERSWNGLVTALHKNDLFYMYIWHEICQFVVSLQQIEGLHSPLEYWLNGEGN